MKLYLIPCQLGRNRLLSFQQKGIRNLSSKVSSTSKPPQNQNEKKDKSQKSQNKKYSDTLQLPKTNFPIKIPNEKRSEHETSIASNFQFEQLYKLQREWRKNSSEFILHDGPPYANGEPHMGHAVNKILKDITNRYKLLRGYKINYISGWDCHGLPIELKAKEKDGSLLSPNSDPFKVRKAAREVAEEVIKNQMSAFKRWGIMADWTDSYHTFNKDYIKTEMQMFYNLFEKGYVYRDLKPVFWSPSTGTALAESEVEYVNHESLSVYLKLPLVEDFHSFSSQIFGELPKNGENGKVEALIWTTTPWSLPANQAVAFNENEDYSILENTPNSYFIIAKKMLHNFLATINRGSLKVIQEFKGSHLQKFKYVHPWFEELTCPFIHGHHVTMEKGTGLVHIAPAHGNDDFVLALKHKLPIACYINDQGLFEKLDTLRGSNAMSLGTNIIIKKLNSKIVFQEKIHHSYPYDWRSKKPIIIKTSLQWFIDTEKIKNDALEQLKSVQIHPNSISNVMIEQLKKRPYWCISRQRVWGVPIPVLYNKETGEPLINQEIINRVCELIEKNGNADFWWNESEEIIQDKNYTKGKDIFDIWLDSGLSWHILKGKVADVYLEGKDQFNGWFYSSLLTSVALRGHPPYKNLIIHGFVVDESNKKMSKSLGNVFNPIDITDNSKNINFGSDVLRWWCATQGSGDESNIVVSNLLLKISEENILKIRNTIRYLLSFCSEESLKSLNIEEITYDELMYADQYMLSLLNTFRNEITAHYDEYNYHRALMKILHFATTQVSANYFVWIKDRLYCDFKESSSRKSCIYVLNEIYLTLAKALAPVLPFLVEESYSHYSSGASSIFKSDWFKVDNKIWNNSQINSLFELIVDLKTSLNQAMGSLNPKEIWVEVLCDEDKFNSLQVLHPEGSEMDKCDSELCDILQVSGVDLRCRKDSEEKFNISPFGVSHSLTGFSLGVSKTELHKCLRCRRFCCSGESVFCTRCSSVIKRLETQKSSSEEKLEDSKIVS